MIFLNISFERETDRQTEAENYRDSSQMPEKARAGPGQHREPGTQPECPKQLSETKDLGCCLLPPRMPSAETVIKSRKPEMIWQAAQASV